MKHQIYKTLALSAFVALFAFLFGSAVFAQPKPAKDESIPPGLYSPLDKFLIEDAKPPLRLSDVTRTVQMLQWATDSDLSHTEFEEFKQIVIAEWREKNPETIRFITDWVAFADRLSGIKKYADQIALKEKTLPVVVADLKKYQNDAKREIIRRAYRRKHGANSLGAFKAEPKILKTSGTLKDILGDWTIQTGAGANMKTVKFSFLANGRATFGDLQSAQKGNCFATETKSKEGAAEVAGDKMILNFSTVKSQRIDSCQPSAVKTENLPAEKLEFVWQIKTDENEMLMLCLTEANGKTACYRKAN